MERIIFSKNRMAICKECEHVADTYVGFFCKKCRCLLNIKTQIASEECPIKKWGKENAVHST